MRSSTVFITLLTGALLFSWALWDYCPPLVATQHFTIVFRDIRPGSAEPLVVTGRPGEGDFLYVKYLGPETIAFGYDKWGSGGPVSAPVRVRRAVAYPLEVEMPSLQRVAGSFPQPTETLRLSCNGVQLLDDRVATDVRSAQRLYFAVNPIGGSSCGPEFHGELLNSAGQILKGGIRSVLSPTARLKGWLRFQRWQLLAILLGASLAGWTWQRWSRIGWKTCIQTVSATTFTHIAFVVPAAICLLAFGWMVTGGSWCFADKDPFGDFYDYQALSLLEGHLDVPGPAISGEAFTVNGKTYGYFGLTPAILRLPFVMAKLAFGSLSRGSMLVGYAAALLAAYLGLGEASRVIAPNRRPSCFPTVVFTLAVGLGSTLFFLSSRAYVYHEAILWGLTFAAFSAWCTLRYLNAPQSRWWAAALATGVLSVHARPPSGLFALTLLGVTAATLAWFARRAPGWRRHVGIGVLAVAGVLSFNGVSYLKFGTAEGMPLRYNTQYTAKRLNDIGGKQLHGSNIPFGFSVYVLEANIEFRRSFPWIFVSNYPRKPQQRFPAAKIDLVDPTLALPLAMPLLFFGATAGGLISILSFPGSRRPISLIWIAALPVTLAMFATVVITHRYTADFLPPLIAAAAFGVTAVDATLRFRLVGRWLAASFAAWSIVVTAAVTLRYQGEQVWGAPEGVQERYRELREHVDGWWRPAGH